MGERVVFKAHESPQCTVLRPRSHAAFVSTAIARRCRIFHNVVFTPCESLVAQTADAHAAECSGGTYGSASREKRAPRKSTIWHKSIPPSCVVDCLSCIATCLCKRPSRLAHACGSRSDASALSPRCKGSRMPPLRENICNTPWEGMHLYWGFVKISGKDTRDANEGRRERLEARPYGSRAASGANIQQKPP